MACRQCGSRIAWAYDEGAVWPIMLARKAQWAKEIQEYERKWEIGQRVPDAKLGVEVEWLTWANTT